MSNYVLIQNTPEELLSAIPETGKFTGHLQCPEGVNFRELGDDRDSLIAKVMWLAAENGYEVNEVRDES